MLDLILLVSYGAAFAGGVYVGSTYGGIKALIAKGRELVKAKL